MVGCPACASKTSLLLLLCFLTVLATFDPPPSSNPRSSSKSPNLSKRDNREKLQPLFNSCNDRQAAQIREAWSSAAQLAIAHAKWEPSTNSLPGSEQHVMDELLGTQSRYDRQSRGKMGPLQQNILRQRGLHYTNQNWSPVRGTVVAMFYCSEYSVPAALTPRNRQYRCEINRNLNAYTWDANSPGLNSKVVVFCPRFFDDGILSDLGVVARRARNNVPGYRDDIRPWLETRARTMLHEAYHWSPEVSIPKCDISHEAYNALGCLLLAAQGNTDVAKLNADSWVQAAISMYILQRYPSNRLPMAFLYGPRSEYLRDDPPIFQRRASDKTENITDRVLQSNSSLGKLRLSTLTELQPDAKPGKPNSTRDFLPNAVSVDSTTMDEILKKMTPLSKISTQQTISNGSQVHNTSFGNGTSIQH